VEISVFAPKLLHHVQRLEHNVNATSGTDDKASDRRRGARGLRGRDAVQRVNDMVCEYSAVCPASTAGFDTSPTVCED
jgi:hypothetical protein